MAFRYFIELQFKGKNFCGWQLQPNEHTVQGELNEKLSLLIYETIETVGAGRTDTGVHAKYFVAHFDCKKQLGNLPGLINKLNRFLHNDIAVINIHHVPNDVHARFSAISRTYRYYISTRKDVFYADISWPLYLHLDINKMNSGAETLLRYYDFTSFSKHHTDVKTKICKINYSHWTNENNMLVYTITADRFLRNMVRAIVGTLIRIGKGKLSVEEFIEIIEAKDRSKAGESAPAQGLFLENIVYPFTFNQINV